MNFIWQDVFLEVATALIYSVVMSEKWINVHVRYIWCQFEEKWANQLRNFSRTSAQALNCCLELCKQSYLKNIIICRLAGETENPENNRKVMGDFNNICHWEQYLIPMLLQGHWYPKIHNLCRKTRPLNHALAVYNKNTSLASIFSLQALSLRKDFFWKNVLLAKVSLI